MHHRILLVTSPFRQAFMKENISDSVETEIQDQEKHPEDLKANLTLGL